MSNAEVVKDLEPQLVWNLFARMSEHPRPSKKEERVSEFLCGVAKEHGFEYSVDAVKNILVHVPGTPGHENAPATIIQGHIDMVCEKNAGTDHNFDEDPIQLILTQAEDGAPIVKANSTTLGADNGIGVAMGLAAACDPNIEHGPLELLWTIDEEAGMSGAKNLERGFMSAQTMINLDSEEDDALYVGCAGGCDVNLYWTRPLVFEAQDEILKITLKGLRGGHSGIDIHENRGNAMKLLARLLNQGNEGDLRLVDCQAGSLRNAIPREAWAVVAGPAGTADRIQSHIAEFTGLAMETFGEDNCEILVESESVNLSDKGSLDPQDTATILRTIMALPSGVQAVVPEIAGEILSSINAAMFDLERQGKNVDMRICCLARSADRQQLFSIINQVTSVGELAGAKVTHGNEYPGWQPNMDSATLAKCRALYAETFGEPARIAAIHAGLECGIINERVGGGLDMVSFGPTITGAHSPDEQVYVESVAKIWQFFCAVLKKLTQA